MDKESEDGVSGSLYSYLLDGFQSACYAWWYSQEYEEMIEKLHDEMNT